MLCDANKKRAKNKKRRELAKMKKYFAKQNK